MRAKQQKTGTNAIAFAEMLLLLREAEFTIDQLAEKLGVQNNTVIRWLRALKRRGKKQVYICGWEDRYTKYAAQWALCLTGDETDVPMPRRTHEERLRRQREARRLRKLSLNQNYMPPAIASAAAARRSTALPDAAPGRSEIRPVVPE